MKKEVKKTKKKYESPKIKKHKSASIASGSGDGGCSYYSARVNGGHTYYW